MALDLMRKFSFRDACCSGEFAASTAIIIAKCCLLLLLVNRMKTNKDAGIWSVRAVLMDNAWTRMCRSVRKRNA